MKKKEITILISSYKFLWDMIGTQNNLISSLIDENTRLKEIIDKNCPDDVVMSDRIDK